MIIYPMITIVILTFNRINFLISSIEGAINQNYPNCEVLIFDNGSTVEISDDIKKILPSNVKYYRHESNSTGNIVYKTIFSLVKTDYILVTHDDDVLEQTFVSNVMKSFDEFPSCVLIGTRLNYIDNMGKCLGSDSYNEIEFKEFGKQEYISQFYNGKIQNLGIPCPTWVFKKDFFVKNEISYPTEAGKASDQFFLFKLNLLYDVKIGLLLKNLLNYRIHGTQDSKIEKYKMDVQLHKSSLKFLFCEEMIEFNQPLIILIFKKLIYTLNMGWIKGEITSLFRQSVLNETEELLKRKSIQSRKMNLLLNLSLKYPFFSIIYLKTSAIYTKFFL
jgi:glycosyltransferase involved in cell wall biosynthesis